MKRSTTVAIAVISLLLGSGASGLLFAMPAHEENGKLTRAKRAATSEKDGLATQVNDLEAKLNSMAMGSISYFDLRKSENRPRELETKTVETLASLTEIFNDHKIRVVKLDPKGESTGMQKPAGAVPEATPAPGATPEPSSRDVNAQAAAGQAAADPEAKPPISLVHKQFAFKVHGEYLDLVRAVGEIQGLPKAISVNQYDMALLDKTGGYDAKPSEDGVPVSPTALELNFQISITFLLSGGPEAETQAALPVPAIAQAPSLVDWFFGLPAEAAEARFRFTGVRYADGGLVIETAPGTPSYEVHGFTSKLLVVTLNETSQVDAERLIPVGQGGIEKVRAIRDPKDPTRVKLAIETDGSVRLKPGLDGRKRLRLAAAPLELQPPRELALPAAQPSAPAKPAVKQAAAAPMVAAKAATKPAAPTGIHQVEGIAYENGEIVVNTRLRYGKGDPTFKIAGGHKRLLILELDRTTVSPASGRVFPIEKDGVIQARAALYKNSPIVSRLVIDTDGTVQLKPRMVGDQLRIAVAPLPGAKRPVEKPAPEAAKPAAVAAAASEAPTATPAPAATPMASPVPTPEPTPEGPRLKRSLSSSYAWDRLAKRSKDHPTGRVNPFKVLPNSHKLSESKPFQPQLVPPVPMGPTAAGAPALPAVPAAPGAAKVAAKARPPYELKAVMIWGNTPPVAVVAVSGVTHQVGLNGSLPGNARVKVIQPDYVILTSNGVDLRLNLKK